MEPGLHPDLNVAGQSNLKKILQKLRDASTIEDVEDFFKGEEIKLNVYGPNKEFRDYTPVGTYPNGLVLSKAFMRAPEPGRNLQESVTYLIVKDNRFFTMETELIETGYIKK